MSDLRRLVEDAVAGNYAVERELGRGGMGAVFLGRDLNLERPVALKVLPPELGSQFTIKERFLRETRIAAGFSHPNIVPVYAITQREQLMVLVMGYIDGETLAQRIARTGALEVPEAVRLLQEMAWALGYAHGRGVVHRDVKPENILIERSSGRAMLTDFGIALGTGASHLTSATDVLGTPQFMSPEQSVGESLDGRSDLYSLGVVAFFALTSRVPFQADSAQAVLAKQVMQPAPPIASLRPDVPPALAMAIDTCLAKAPSARFASGEALAASLDAARTAYPEVAPPLRLFVQRVMPAVSQMLLVLLALVLIPRQTRINDDIVVRVALAAVLFGLFRGIVAGARELLQLGYTSGQFRYAVDAITAERRSAARRARSTTALRRSARRSLLAWIGVALVGLAGLVLAPVYLTTEGAPGHRMTTTGLTVSFLSLGCLALAVVAVWTDWRRRFDFSSLQRWIWTGPVATAVFRLASRGMPAVTHPSQSVNAHERRDEISRWPWHASRAEFTAIHGTLDRIERAVGALTARLDAFASERNPPDDGVGGGAHASSRTDE
jgi:predicted Ser/Thr protein kinase